MAKLPLTRPVYMVELGRRMGIPSREARRALRRIERARRAKLLFKTKPGKQGRLWTTDALLAKFCPELIDKPKRISQEVRAFSRSVTEKFAELQERIESMKAENDHELSAIRRTLSSLGARGHT